MPNIPPIPRHQQPMSRRAGKIEQADASAPETAEIKRQLERRRRQDRRQRQIHVMLNRRQRGMQRRKALAPEKNIVLSDTVGKHINTIA